MPDLESKLRAYAVRLDERYPDVTLDELTNYRTLRDWSDGAGPVDLADVVSAERARTLRLSDDEPPSGTSNRRRLLIAAAAALVVIGVAGLALAITNDHHRPPAPVATDSVAPPTTAATVSIAPTTTAATHTFSVDLPDANNIHLTLTMPEGWLTCCDSTHYVPLYSPGFDVRFDSVSNIYSDGCHMTPLDPPLGPSVDDLVTAWANMPELAPTAPVDITVDGYTGKQIELTVPDDVAACQRAETYGFGIWMSNPSPGEPASDRSHYAEANTHFRMLVLDVDGTRLLIAATTDQNDDASEQARTAFEEFVASGIQINSPPVSADRRSHDTGT